MRVVNPGAGGLRCCSVLIARSAFCIAAAMIVFATKSVSAATDSSSATVPANVRAITQSLAAGVHTESCSADIVPIAPLPMFGARGAADADSDDPPTIGAMCALPFVSGKPGGDCNAKHTIRVQTFGTGPNAKVTAELLALDTAGVLIDSALVKDGDQVHMSSRLSPADWKFTKDKKEFEVFAPVPLVKVTVEDQGQKAEAYCSNIPYLDVIQPNGGVVTESSGEGTEVVAAVPLTDPSSLHLFVNGDDLLADVPSFLGCTPSAPCSGTATINGQSVGYSNLMIDIASGINSLSSNTVRVTLTDLACGAHYVKLSTSALTGALKNPTTSTCNLDDLTDQGTASIFAISITDPVPGQITPIVPTPVAGEVCSGTEIVNVNVNGKNLSLAGQTHQAGNGTTSGDVWKVIIDTTLDRTDLVRDVLDTHDAPLGTFDAGSNRLAVSAREVQGTRTYKRLIFATGDVAPIGVDVNASVFQASAMMAAVSTQLKQMVEAKVQPLMTASTTELQNAFVVGLSAGGVQTLFNNLCSKPLNAPGDPLNGLTPGQIFKQKVTEAINSIGTPHISPDVPCASDPDVALSITNVSVGDTVACTVTFNEDFFHVTIALPNIHVDVHAFGTGGDWGDDICVEGVKVEGNATADVTGIKLEFDVTENNLLQNTFSNANFNAGATATAEGGVGVDFCGLSVVCNVIVTIFTFGAVDINPHIDFSLVQDFSSQIGANKPDPVTLHEIKVDETVVANFDQKMSGVVSSVNITPEGISAGLKGEFATLALDTDVEATPGITLTPAPVPTMQAMQSQGAKDALIGLSDDSINMMFASLTAAGKLKPGDDPQGCVDTGATVGSLLPADCDTLDVGDDLADAAARGYCHAIKGDSCASLAFGTDPFLTSTEQGVCFGASGATCSEIANFDLVRFGACSITPNFNLEATQPLLFCAKGDVPPRMLFPNSGSPGGLVPSALRVNDLTVALVIDRTENHVVDGSLAAAPSCFAGGASNAADCNVFSACLDLNLNFGMQFLTCSDGKPGFKSVFDSIQILQRDIGVVCSGVASPTSDGDVLNTASDDTITIPIGQNAGTLSPDICGAGLDLQQLVTCAAPQILSIEADGSPSLRDYLGITCKIQ